MWVFKRLIKIEFLSSGDVAHCLKIRRMFAKRKKNAYIMELKKPFFGDF